MPNVPYFLRIILAMLVVMVLWMGYFYLFRTDGRGHVLGAAQPDSPAARAAGERLLVRADTLVRRKQFAEARHLLDSLRDAEANPAVYVDGQALRSRYATLAPR